MSTHNPPPSAVEVSNRMYVSLPIPTTPSSKRNQPSCEDNSRPSSIFCHEACDLEKSISLVSWPMAADSLEASAVVSMEGADLQQEQRNLKTMELEVDRTQKSMTILGKK